MDKVSYILDNKIFLKCLRKNQKFEKNRKFCKHDLEHFLSTARIAYIYNLENNLGFSKEVIYSAALLHDLGRYKEYKKNIPHDKASAKIAKRILKNSPFTKTEISLIVSAIENHRILSENKKTFEYCIYYGDKKSRNCFLCKAKSKCDWPEEKKNSTIY